MSEIPYFGAQGEGLLCIPQPGAWGSGPGISVQGAAASKYVPTCHCQGSRNGYWEAWKAKGTWGFRAGEGVSEIRRLELPGWSMSARGAAGRGCISERDLVSLS